MRIAKNSRVMRALFTAAFLTIVLPGTVRAAAEKKTAVGFYLDTVITLTAYTDSDELLQDALQECGRYEELLSRTIEGSDVWRINHADGKAVKVSDDTMEILKTAIQVSELSGGAFDVSIAPASTLWDFTSGATVLPDSAKLEEAASRIDYSLIEAEEDEVTVPEGMMIDLGGVAKGYIADRIKQYLEERGVERAVLSFGGNIVCIGTKEDGSPWKIGIQDIDQPTGSYMMVAANYGGSTVTSGIYERGFELDGVYYHHILDPDSGWPVQNELASVTIFSESSMWGDALATAAFVLGTEDGMKMIEELDGIEAVFIRHDREAVFSSGADAYMLQK